MTVAKKPVHRGELGISRKTIAQGMFWCKNALNINVLRMLCRRLCRDPQKLLIAEKKFQRGPLIRLRGAECLTAPMSKQRMGAWTARRWRAFLAANDLLAFDCSI